MNAPLAAILVTAMGWLFVATAEPPAAPRFPPPDFESNYQLPVTAWPAARATWRDFADVTVLALALSAAAWLALKKRSRTGMLALSVFSLVYFGFYRAGCICPIGAIENVTLALVDGHYAVPLVAVLFFALPLLFALLFGRVFCGGVCPLGAIQDVVLIRPVRLPLWLQEALGILPIVYLGAAVLFAVLDTMFIICRYDPFVAVFRLGGGFGMLIVGGIVLLAAMFIGRPYCRFACPYRVLLGLCSRLAWRHATITPDQCVVCSLCEGECPFGAIRRPTPEGAVGEE
jgi:polyferredoxin